MAMESTAAGDGASAEPGPSTTPPLPASRESASTSLDLTHVAAAAVAVVAVAVAVGSARLLALLLAASVAANLVLLALHRASSRRAASLEACLTRPELPWESKGGPLEAAKGLQRLVNAAWAGARDALAQAEFAGMVRRVELSEALPKVLAVREVESPADGVVCYDVDLAWSDDAVLLSVDLNIKLLGVLRAKLARVEGTLQVYLWSDPPQGRGDGTPYSLVEASLSPAPPHPPLVAVELEAGDAASTLLKRTVPHLQRAAAAVVDELLLPRLTAFQRRLLLLEVPLVDSQGAGAGGGEDSWQGAARRAGWLPRGEAELENAVGEMVHRATGYAWEQASGATDALQGRLAAGLEAGQWAKGLVSDAAAGAATVVSGAATGAVASVSGVATGAVTTVSGAATGAVATVTGVAAGAVATVSGAATGAVTTVSGAAAEAGKVVQSPTEQVAAAARAGLEAGHWAQQKVSEAAAGAATALGSPGEQAAQAAWAAAGAAAGAVGKFGLSLEKLRGTAQPAKLQEAPAEAPAEATPEHPPS